MSKVIRWVQNFLMIGFPIAVFFMILSKTLSNPSHLLSSIMGLVIVSWFALLIFFLITLVLNSNVREKTLCRLANLKERDEREEYITGKATRTAYISTLSLIILFLFFSMFSINLNRAPKPNTNDHRYELNLSFGFSLWNKSETKTNPEIIAVFNSKDVTPSMSTMMLILLGWQLISFNLSARKENMKLMK